MSNRRATATVLEVGKLNFLNNSNAISRKWFTKLKLGNKTDAIGCLVLSEIVFWYTPDFIKDEATGRTIEIRRRFDGDVLQKNAKQLAERFGFSDTQIYDALARLENAGVIRKEIRPVETQSGVLPKVMFIHLNVPRLRDITEYNEDDLEALSPVGKKVLPVDKSLSPVDKKLSSTGKSLLPVDDTTVFTTEITTVFTTEEKLALAFASDPLPLPLDIPLGDLNEIQSNSTGKAKDLDQGSIQVETTLPPNSVAPPSPQKVAKTARKAAETPKEQKAYPSAFCSLRAAYEAAIGHSAINWGQAGAGLKKLEKAGCTSEELISCYKWIKTDQFWATKPVSTQTIFNQIGEWRRLQIMRAGSIDPNKLSEFGCIPAGTGTNPLEVYYESFAYSDRDAKLDPRGEQDLNEQCPDLVRLRAVCEAYRRTTYKRGNLGLIIDWYTKGVPPHGKSNGSYSQRNTNILPRTEGGYNPYAGCTAEQVAEAFRPRTDDELAEQKARYEQLAATMRANRERRDRQAMDDQRAGKPYTGH